MPNEPRDPNDPADREPADREPADRGRAEREKRERVIHTRVSERLEAELKERAAGLGVSVSNLVRNVLGNAFDLVEGIVADSASVARSAASNWRDAHGGGVAGGGVVPPGPVVIGWQDLVLDINAVCSRCNDILPRGADAAIAIVRGGGDRPIICPRCLEEIRHGSKPAPGSDREPTGE
jgi:hypothetical protein